MSKKDFNSFYCINMCYIIQVIQRQLEEVGEKQRDLEERGVAIEKILRGEAGIQQHVNTQQRFMSVSEPEQDITKLILMTKRCAITPCSNPQYTADQWSSTVKASLFCFLIAVHMLLRPFRNKALPCNPSLVKSLYIQLMVVLTIGKPWLYCSSFTVEGFVCVLVIARACEVEAKCVCVFEVWSKCNLVFLVMSLQNLYKNFASSSWLLLSPPNSAPFVDFYFPAPFIPCSLFGLSLYPA